MHPKLKIINIYQELKKHKQFDSYKSDHNYSQLLNYHFYPIQSGNIVFHLY